MARSRPLPEVHGGRGLGEDRDHDRVVRGVASRTEFARRNLTEKKKRWWQQQRLHGLCEAMHQQIKQEELAYISKRLKTPGGLAKLKRLLRNGSPKEYLRGLANSGLEAVHGRENAVDAMYLAFHWSRLFRKNLTSFRSELFSNM
jgi:hypothetical protein